VPLGSCVFQSLLVCCGSIRQAEDEQTGRHQTVSTRLKVTLGPQNRFGRHRLSRDERSAQAQLFPSALASRGARQPHATLPSN
jgi:hypothetical protein